MKNWKKITSLLLAMAMVLSLAACGGKQESSEESSASETSQSSEESSSEAASSEASSTAAEPEAITGENLYLVTDLGTIDDKSFNQGSFEGLKAYAAGAGLAEPKYIKPAGEGDQIYKQAIDQAIAAGAKVVVTPGFLFEVAVGQAQEEYPDAKFILIDAEPKVGDEYKVGANTVSILYREEQAGFLAGYAAVKDGYTKLGFMGGVAVPAVIRYGFGYIAGANYAAKEMNTKVEVKYNYTGSFVAKPEIATMASSWYTDGTEVIFSCGGGIAASVLKAAQENGGKMIGVDVDQKDMGEEVITSAMKNLSGSVNDAVKTAVEGGFAGGTTLRLGVNEKGVQISDDFSRFKTFTQEDYQKIYDAIVNNTDGLADSIPVIDSTLKEAEQSNPTLIPNLENIELNYIQ